MKNRPGGKAPSHKAQGARWLAPGIAALLFAGALALYWPATHFSFLNWDDLTFIAKNDHVKGGLTWQSVKWVFTHAYSANWAPLSWISHMIDVQIHGLQPRGHHLTNSVLHAANSALLFFALLALTRARWRSAFVAALFAVHPLHVESVAWIAERRDVLSGLFFMLTLLTYGKYAIRDERELVPAKRLRGSDGLHDVPRISGHRIGGESRPGGIVPAFKRILASPAYWVCLVLFALGLMSKPMLVTMPFVLLLLDYWPLGRFDFQRSDFFRGSKTASPLPSFWRLLAEKIPFLLLSAATCAITFLSQRQAGAVASLETLSFGSRLENVPIAYCEYLEKFFWPSRLSPLYAHPPSWPAAQVLLCAAVLVAISLAAWKLRARFPYLLVGWCWFLGMLVPVIGLVQVGSQAFADRYTYLPLIGVMIALTWVVARVGRAYPRAAA
ncbi:MAG TPA: hypothetical protein VHH88_12555, partial [Verrucomicrobiae bacterium]|nr:hypothetical protein [Verrucomicrobiae bacterium]